MGQEQSKYAVPDVQSDREQEFKFPLEFSHNAKAELEKKGFKVCFIARQSLQELSNDYPFEINLREKILFSRTINEKPQPGEVAYKPDEPFLEGSNNKNYYQQYNMVESNLHSLEIPGTQRTIEPPAVYLQIQGDNYARTGTESWLGEKNSARTSTPGTLGSSIAINSRNLRKKSDLFSRMARGKSSGFHIFERDNMYKGENLYVINSIRPTLVQTDPQA